MDALELFLGNEAVYIEHNFPDILKLNYKDYKNSKSKYPLAALSGVICTWPLLIPLLIKIGLLLACSKDKKQKSNRFRLVHLFLAIDIAVANLAVLLTYNTMKHTIYRNHIYFYYIHIVAELISLGYVLILTIC
ncbi:hypothetical protein ECANGB1_1247 [Enterospora canceri]|uniref:Uncharacterized protein n=1 Tax=Enterospora canceri TaxID=1081671 RepID=A0A1Y1S6D8_9MICR|nr:hypothetical protein ECANGB1_1247 [Enterospora canceri]